jgi:hypothetical protein
VWEIFYDSKSAKYAIGGKPFAIFKGRALLSSYTCATYKELVVRKPCIEYDEWAKDNSKDLVLPVGNLEVKVESLNSVGLEGCIYLVLSR